MAQLADSIFQKSLQDLVKGIRSHKRDTSTFISQAILEIKLELKSSDPFIKSEAVRKAIYLQMIGFDVAWSFFSVIEVMSQTRFAHKRIGYLAANQLFDETTEVILLSTNLLKKEFTNLSTGPYEIGLAVNCLANIANKELARDCLGDVVTLMNHSKPYVRKKAVLAIYKLYVKYPQGLRLTFDKLKERLDDNEMPVVSTAVNVICELAHKNPRNYLPMAPKLFRLLTTSSNNWMLIKVVKLMTSLVSEEPRLARKLLDPLAAIIVNTTAKSLQYECIFALTEAFPHTKKDDGSEVKNISSIVKLCSDHLRLFVADADQNLKYLGLVGLCNLLRSSPRSVVDHRDAILQCLHDEDITIRVKALELLAGIVSKRSVVDLVNHLVEHAGKSEESYREQVIDTVLNICKKEKYALISDFAWYLSVLFHLAVLEGSRHGLEIAQQIIDLAIRVSNVRPFAIELSLGLLFDEKSREGSARGVVVQVLKACAFVLGEYPSILVSIEHDKGNGRDVFWIEGARGEEIRSYWRGQRVVVKVLEAFFDEKAKDFPKNVGKELLAQAISVLFNGLNSSVRSFDLEVQERTSLFNGLISRLCLTPHSGGEDIDFEKAAESLLRKRSALQCLLGEPLYAVHHKAQKMVPVPEGLEPEGTLEGRGLERLCRTELGEDLQLQKVRLLPEYNYARMDAASNNYRERYYDVEDQERRTSNNNSRGNISNFNSDAASVNTGYTTKQSDESSIFMLGGGARKTFDLQPLSRVLGESALELPESWEEDSRGRARDSDKRKKRVKKDKKRVLEINRRDVLPIGAYAHEDEGEEKGLGSSGNLVRRSDIDFEPNDLSAVDLSRPLGADEVIYVPKHRVETSQRVAKLRTDGNNTGNGARDGDGKNGAKVKLISCKSSSKSKRRGKKEQEPASSSDITADLLALDYSLPSLPEKTKDVNFEEKTLQISIAKAAGEGANLSLLVKEEGRVNVAASVVAIDSKQLEIVLRVKSEFVLNIGLDVEYQFDPQHLVSNSSNKVGKLRRIQAESEERISLSVSLKENIWRAKALPVQLYCCSSDGFSQNYETSLPLSVFQLCSSLKVDSIESFHTLMDNRSCNIAASASTDLFYSKDLFPKSSSVFKALKGSINAHLLEVKSSKNAAALASQTIFGHQIFLLGKLKKSESRKEHVLRLDVKLTEAFTGQLSAAELIDLYVTSLKEASLIKT